MPHPAQRSQYSGAIDRPANARGGLRGYGASAAAGETGATGTPSASPAQPSPLQAALDRVGDRWCLLVVESLLEGPLRFNDLQAALPGIAPNILSDRLKRLERERVLLARPYSQHPLRLSYELTAEGRELAGALRLLADWGARDSSDVLRHHTCGTPLEARWYCPTCARAIAEDEATELRRL